MCLDIHIISSTQDPNGVRTVSRHGLRAPRILWCDIREHTCIRQYNFGHEVGLKPTPSPFHGLGFDHHRRWWHLLVVGAQTCYRVVLVGPFSPGTSVGFVPSLIEASSCVPSPILIHK